MQLAFLSVHGSLLCVACCTAMTAVLHSWKTLHLKTDGHMTRPTDLVGLVARLNFMMFKVGCSRSAVAMIWASCLWCGQQCMPHVQHRPAHLPLCMHAVLLVWRNSPQTLHAYSLRRPTDNSLYAPQAQQQHVLLLHAESAVCGEHSLALAVLYYVSPDTGFTLDILQWSPGDTALCVKLRLQLHELADMHSFLLGCIVLDMCAFPTYQSGECMGVTQVFMATQVAPGLCDTVSYCADICACV